MDLLLLYPPAAKVGEPPLGVAILFGYLRARNLQVEAIDANLDAYLYLLDEDRLRSAAGSAPSTALRRALNHASRSLQFLRSPAASQSFSRYRTAVHHLNRALQVYRGTVGDERLTLGDYTHNGVSEFVPADLERVVRGEVGTLFDDYFRLRVLPQVIRRSQKVVAISVNYRHQVLPAFALAGLLRRHCPELTLVGGGGMLSSWRSVLKEQDLRFSAFSHVVFGPGETSLAALAEGTGSAEYFLEDPSVVGFDPDFSFASPTAYLSPLPILPVSASRGCYWCRCLFCPEAATPTHPYVGNEPGAFVDQLTTLAERYGVRHYHLTDNAVPIQALQELVARREKLAGICWHGFVRFERVLLDPDFVFGLAASGCRMLQLGLESGSQRVLDHLQKGTRLDQVAQMLANLRQAGIATYVYIMLGTPGETREDAELTLQFLEQHAGAISYLNVAIMNLPRESRLLDDPSATGIDASAPLSADAPLGLYRSFVSSSGWGRGEARRFLQQRLLGSPVIREIVNRTPPYFTSNHAFLFSR
jgi:Radical SAM superfamily